MRHHQGADDMGATLAALRALGEDALAREEKVALLQSMRGRSPEVARMLDLGVIEEIERTNGGLHEARKILERLQALLQQYSASPLYPAIFLGAEQTPHGLLALVATGSGRRAVPMAEGMDVRTLACGEEVYLGHEQNLVIARSCGRPACGEIAAFQRYAPGGRLVLKLQNEEEYVVDAAGPLVEIALKPGDTVLWDRSARLCLERMHSVEQSPFMFDFSEVPDLGLERVGGQDAHLKRLLDALSISLLDHDKAQRYRIEGSNTVFLFGPPGCGKTLRAQVAVSEIAKRAGKKTLFGVVKAAAFESPWVGETQRKITECFQCLRRAAEETGGLAVLFLDEVDALSRQRGGMMSHYSDKFLATILAEMDGFHRLQNVCLISSSNRKDLIDPAFLERAAGVEIYVPRPDLRAARTIFSVHLDESVPYCPNGTEAKATRLALIETAVSRLYSPNAGNDLCTLTFRDGKTRTIMARDLMSGRLIQQICLSAKRAAFRRDVEGGESGVQACDIESAISEALERLSTTITRYNAHAHLDDLPQDVDVVSVAPVVRRVPRPQRYLSVNRVPSKGEPHA